MKKKNMKPRSIRGVALAVLALTPVLVGVTACSSGAGQTSGSTGSTGHGNIQIGMIDSFTGLNANLGNVDLCGAEVAVAAINSRGGANGQKLELVTADDQSTEAVSAQQAQKLTSQGIRLFVGGVTTGGALAELPFFKKTSSLYAGGTTKSDQVLDYDDLTIRINSSSEQDMKWMGDYISKNIKPGPVSFIGENNTFTQGELDYFKKSVDQSTYPVDDVLVPVGTTSWSSFITKIQSSKPSVVVDAANGGSQEVSWFKDAHTAGLTVPQLAIPGALSSTVISDAGADATEGVISADIWVPAVKSKGQTTLKADYAKLASKSSACNGMSLEEAGKQMVLTYSQVLAIADGADAAKSTDPKKIRSTLIAGTWQMPFGAVTFQSSGQANQKYYEYKVSDGKQVALKD